MAAIQWTKIGMGATKAVTLSVTTFDPPLRGVHINVAGTISGQLAEDSANRDWIVNAGQTYPLCFKSIANLGTATGNGLY